MPASVNSTLASFIHDLPWEMVQAAEMPHFWYAFHFNGRLHDWGPFYYFLPCTFIHHEPHLLSLHWDGSHQAARVGFLPCRSLPPFGTGRKRVALEEGKVSRGEAMGCRGSELRQAKQLLGNGPAKPTARRLPRVPATHVRLHAVPFPPTTPTGIGGTAGQYAGALRGAPPGSSVPSAPATPGSLPDPLLPRAHAAPGTA